MAPPLVYIIILNYNGAHLTLDCLRSVSRVDYPNLRILIVDNASTDGSATQLRTALRDPRAELLVNSHNQGYAGGNNRGIEKALSAGADYVCVLNNDTIVEPGFLRPLVRAMEHDASLGIVSCPHIDVRFPDSPLYCWRVNLFWGAATRVSGGAAEWDLGPLDFIPGAAFLMRADTLQRIGMFDERFFLDWEDVDLCFRIRRAGYRLRIIGAPGIQHLAGQTTNHVRSFVTFYTMRNRAWVVRRHGEARHQIVFYLYNFCYLYPRTILGRLRRGQFEFLGPTLRGIWHGHFSYPGDYPANARVTSRVLNGCDADVSPVVAGASRYRR